MSDVEFSWQTRILGRLLYMHVDQVLSKYSSMDDYMELMVHLSALKASPLNPRRHRLDPTTTALDKFELEHPHLAL